MPAKQDGRLNTIRQHSANDRAVVFLHGFTGDRDDTWDRFPTLLGTHVQDWDIFTLGYATTMLPDVVGVWSADPDLPILATMFRTQLMIQPLDQYRSLAIVAHSMGGLVVQKALVDDSRLTERVRHVIMFGTPSSGLRKAWWLKFWKRQLRNMARGSDFIVELRLAWVERFEPQCNFQLTVVAGSTDQFVTPDSCLEPFDPRLHRVVPGNHLSMVKPSGANATSLRLVISALSADAEPPAEATAALSLAAERPTADVSALVEERERDEKKMSEGEVVGAALALERVGKRDKAIELLERQKALGTDVQGTLAGRMKRIWLESEDEYYARRALELYQDALNRATDELDQVENKGEKEKAHGQIYYHAINIAFLNFVVYDRRKNAREMANLAIHHADQTGYDVWSLATRAEANLYLGKRDIALKLYRRMLEQPGEAWQYASASLQAGQIASKLDDVGLAEKLEELFTPRARQVNKIFVSYCHKDAEWAERLQIMAKPYLRDSEAELDFWSDIRIEAGDVWREEIREALAAAGVVVALVSADFLASDFVWKHEMPEILNAAKDGELRLLWIYLSPAGWEETPLKDFQATHDTKKCLAALELYEQDEVLKAAAREIKRAALGATGRFVAH